jgi:hypothetical protein
MEYHLNLIFDPGREECRYKGRYKDYIPVGVGAPWNEVVAISKQWFRYDSGASKDQWEPVGADDHILGGDEKDPLRVGDRIRVMIAIPDSVAVSSIKTAVLVACDSRAECNSEDVAGSPFYRNGHHRAMFLSESKKPVSIDYDLQWFEVDLGEIHKDIGGNCDYEQFRLQVATEILCMDREGKVVHVSVGHDPVMRVDEGGG